MARKNDVMVLMQRKNKLLIDPIFETKRRPALRGLLYAPDDKLRPTVYITKVGNKRYWHPYVTSRKREQHKHYDLTSRYVVLSYSLNYFWPTANSARSRWFPRGHMTSKSETISRQNLLAGNIT